MKDGFQINEISKFFNVPASTLRYWEEMGVLAAKKNPENGYRIYTVSDLMTISDILFYKNLGIPLKKIRDMEKMDLQAHQDLCVQQAKTIRQQQLALEQRMKKLQFHIEALEMICKLQERPYTEEKVDADCIVPFELIEIEKLKRYIQNPYVYSRVQHSSCMEQEQRGLSVTCSRKEVENYKNTLWKNNGGKYVVCLMKEEIADGYPNDLFIHLAEIQRIYKTGYVISRFLTCAQENGKTYDFYKTYIEIL